MRFAPLVPKPKPITPAKREPQPKVASLTTDSAAVCWQNTPPREQVDVDQLLTLHEHADPPLMKSDLLGGQVRTRTLRNSTNLGLSRLGSIPHTSNRPDILKRVLRKADHSAPIATSTKLEVGDANDPLEQEADEIADEVMRVSTLDRNDTRAGWFSNTVLSKAVSRAQFPLLDTMAPPQPAKIIARRKYASCDSGHNDIRRDDEGVVQRACATCGANDEPRRVCSSCSADDDEILRAPASCDSGRDELRNEPGAGPRGGTVSDVFSNKVQEQIRLGGSSLPVSARGFLEPRLGTDLGRLRVHAGRAAGLLAREIGARAFTLGHNLFFAPGELRPQTRAGMWLLAHEVAHTLQSANVSPGIHRAPPETDGTATITHAELDYGEDLLEQDEEMQELVRLTRAHLLDMIRDFMRPSEETISEEGEPLIVEEVSSVLDYFEVPAHLKNAADQASMRFILVTEYLDASSDRSAVLMSQWLDAAATFIDKLSACLRWIVKNKGDVGELIGGAAVRRLRVLDRRVHKLRKRAFFKKGAELEAEVREVETAEKIQQLKDVLEEQLGHLRQETRADWMSVPEDELRDELERLQEELVDKKGTLFVGDAAQQSRASWDVRVVETKIEVLSELLQELDFVAGPTVTERAQRLAKTVIRDLEHGAKLVAGLIEQALASEPVNASDLETVIDTFRWVDFYDQATTKSERLAGEVLAVLSNPAATLLALSGHERGQIIVGWLSPERRPELEFTMLVVSADPGYEGESPRPASAAIAHLRGLGHAARPYAVVQATSTLARSGSLNRYAAFDETRHLLVEMAYQLWADGYSHDFVNTGDELADAVASVSNQIGATIPAVESVHVERADRDDDLIVTMRLRDFTSATRGLGADGDTAYAMVHGGGVRVSPSDTVVLLTEDGRVSVPALKLIEAGAKAERGMFKAAGQDFARWSSETAKSVSEGIEHRTKARLEWLEGVVADSADGARDFAREYLEGENLRRAEALIGAIEFAGEGMVASVTAVEGLRVGVQTAAVNTVGGLGEIGGNLAAGVAELGSDTLEGRALSDLAIEYDHVDHKIRVTIDAAPEIASDFYNAAVAKLEQADGFEKVFILSKVGGQILFEVGITFVGGGATKVGKLDDLSDAGRILNAGDTLRDIDRAADVARLSEKASELADKGLVRSADHFDAIDSGARRQLDSDTMAKVADGIPSGAKVWVDDRLPDRTVIVEFDMPHGIVDPSSIRLVAARNADPDFIRLHGRTVTDLRRFSGWQGRARRLIAKILELLDLAPPEARRQALIEAKLEVEKHQRIVNEGLRQLAKAEPGAAEAQKIVDELEEAWTALDDWRRVVDGEVELGDAKGHIAGGKGSRKKTKQELAVEKKAAKAEERAGRRAARNEDDFEAEVAAIEAGGRDTRVAVAWQSLLGSHGDVNKLIQEAITNAKAHKNPAAWLELEKCLNVLDELAKVAKHKVVLNKRLFESLATIRNGNPGNISGLRAELETARDIIASGQMAKNTKYHIAIKEREIMPNHQALAGVDEADGMWLDNNNQLVIIESKEAVQTFVDKLKHGAQLRRIADWVAQDASARRMEIRCRNDKGLERLFNDSSERSPWNIFVAAMHNKNAQSKFTMYLDNNTPVDYNTLVKMQQRHKDGNLSEAEAGSAERGPTND